ncbi:MAG TPA: hypothetical protein VEJ18_18385, partial [Planctomycetota bacterium]|nr:hypothetical protein [Planctomycetota bacterium]
MRAWLPAALLLLGASFPDEKDRSPVAIALSADGRRALTANSTADSVSLVDLEAGTVLAEAPAGVRPRGVALSGDGLRGAAACERDDRLALFDVRPDGLAPAGHVDVGDEPRGVVLSDDGTRAWVSLAGEDAVVEVDLRSRSVVARAETGEEPGPLVRTPDGRRLVVGNTRGGGVTILEVSPLRAVRTIALPGARNVRGVAVAPDGRTAYFTHIVDRGGPTTLRAIADGHVLVNRLGRAPLDGEGPAESLAMDVRGFASADLEGIDVAPDGRRLGVVAGGVRAVFLLSLPLPFSERPGDVADKALAGDKARFLRNGLRGRPVAVRYRPGGATLVVANALRNELQVVRASDGEVERTIPLGGPAEPSTPARRGEALFYDGYGSYHEWFSCHTCHLDGHTNGGLYDTFNDGKAGNPKKALSLRGVTKTGPWTWHGVQKGLPDSLQGSFRRTMGRGTLLDSEIEALTAFLDANDFGPPPPVRDAAAVARGKAVFEAKTCSDCHPAPFYTRSKVYEVGLETRDDAFQGFNPPPLRGVGRRGPWLHDGRA